MNKKELIALARELAHDKVTPSLWSDDFILGALNAGEWEACRRARLIIDSSTAKVCRIALADGIADYVLHESVIFIRRVKLSTRDEPLGFARMRDMDMNAPGWESETGDVVGWITDRTTGKLTFWRTPTSAELPATVTLTVVRGPLKPMKEDGDRPEIHPRLHENLVHWPLYRMYSVQDTERNDPKRAADHLALFEAEFGKASPVIEERWIDQNFDYAAELGVF